MPDFNFTIPSQYYPYYVISGIVLASVWCFFGYRIFRFVLGVGGFITGALVAGVIGYEFSEGRELYTIGAAILGGLLGAGLMFGLYLLGVFAIGALMGAFIAYTVFLYMSIEPDTMTLLITAVVTGIVAVFIKRFMIVLATSFTGAWAIVSGFTYFLKSNFNPLEPESVLSFSEDQMYRFLIVWFGIAVAGFTVQYILIPKDYESEDEYEGTDGEDNEKEEILLEDEVVDEEIIELDEPYVEQGPGSTPNHDTNKGS